MSGIVCAPINNLPATAATCDALPAKLLADCHQIWGILRSIEPVGGGLIRATLGARETLVPEELSADLQDMIGQPVAICRLLGQWGCGRIPQ